MNEKKNIKVTAVIPVHNSSSYIDETLNSIINQQRQFDEIIVVDDSSTDDTVAKVKKYSVKVLEIPPSGRSAARNIGWREARGDVIAFIESDAVYESDWLYEVMKAFDEGHRAVIDRRRMYHPKTCYARLSDHIYDLRYADYVPFNAWIMERSLLEEGGGFDESLSIAEDVELGDRIKALGVKIYCAKEAVHYHKGEASTFQEAVRRSYTFGRGMLDYWWKDPEERRFLSLAWKLALSWGIFCPPIFVCVFAMKYGRRLLWAMDRGMKARYLPIEPLLYTINQLFFQVGATVTLLRYLFIEKKVRFGWNRFISSTEERG